MRRVIARWYIWASGRGFIVIVEWPQDLLPFNGDKNEVRWTMWPQLWLRYPLLNSGRGFLKHLLLCPKIIGVYFFKLAKLFASSFKAATGTQIIHYYTTIRKLMATLMHLVFEVIFALKTHTSYPSDLSLVPCPE